MAVLFLILIKLTENKRVEMTEKVSDGGNDRDKHGLFSWRKWREKNDRKSHDTTQITINQK